MRACMQAQDLVDPPGKYAHLGGGLSVVYDLSVDTGTDVATGRRLSQTGTDRLLSLKYDCMEVQVRSLPSTTTS